MKTDRVDTLGLLRVLLRLERGEAEMTRVVWVPAPMLEDARRQTRERERLVNERTAHRNRIQGLLAAQGVTAVKLGARDWLDRLADARTGDGRILGQRCSRRSGARPNGSPWSSAKSRRSKWAQYAALKADTPWAAKACKLKRLKGLGEVFASGLTRGVLARLRQPPPGRWRLRDDTVAVGQWRHARRRADQQGPQSAGANVGDRIAWMWTLNQPDSALARWWRARFAGGGRRLRRIGIVALARKLMVALWRYLEQDRVPEGAVLA